MTHQTDKQNSRRSFLKSATLGATVPLFATSAMNAEPTTNVSKEKETSKAKSYSFRYCLNTSTIREAKLPLPKLIEMTSNAGYDGIELWIREIDRFVQQGGKLSDIRKQLDDVGLQVESAIGFPTWATDDDKQRKAGFEEAKRAMGLVRQLGCKRMAAPPIGIHRSNAPHVELKNIAKRYRELLDLGVSMEVIPQVEIWGSSKNLSHISEAIFVATAANHPQAAILPDIYHLFRGDSGFDWIRMMSGDAIQIFHINDYPLKPLREQQKDSHRVYPGDGVAPMKLIFQSLKKIGFHGALSLELFNKEYWKQKPEEVAKTGLAKMKKSVADALR